MFNGSIVALITPFNNGEVDEAALRNLVNRQIDQGTNAIVPVGTTGESPTVSHTEHKRVVEIVIEETAGRIPVIAGAGSNNTIAAIELTVHAKEAGADGVLHVAGYYNRPSQEGLYQHFKAIHDAVEIPMVIYNIPPRAVVDIQPETMARLAQLSHVAGVKDATGDLSRIGWERQLIAEGFAYLSGDDATAVAYNANGGMGCISVTANIAPKLCADLQNACSAGDFAAALEIQDRLMPLHGALFQEPSPAGVKYAASLLGLCSDYCRLPIIPLADETKQTIKKAMTQLELI